MKQQSNHPARRCLAALAFATAAFAWPAAAHADRAAPPLRPSTAKPGPVMSDLDVTFSRKVRTAVIKLPHRVFERLLARNRQRKKGAWLLPEGRTMIAGVVLALGFAFAGLWLARGKRRRLALGPLLSALGVGALLMFGGAAEGKKRKKVEDVLFGGAKLAITVTRGRTVRLDIDGAKVCDSLDAMAD